MELFAEPTDGGFTADVLNMNFEIIYIRKSYCKVSKN